MTSHTILVLLHVSGALSALITGFLAFRLQANTPRHRIVGKIYLVSWLMLAGAGFILGSDDSQISPFEVLTLFGFVQMVIAYGAVVFRKRLGRRWLLRHYDGMLGSYTGVVIASANQILINSNDVLPYYPYGFVIFWAMIALAFPINTRIIRQLNERYNLTERKTVKEQPLSVAP